jgi:glucose-1-phosphate thymidylyltransferase
MKKQKGVILAGGSGTRLLPLTRYMNKHMTGVLNVPMILYPLHTLKQLGVEDVLVVSGGGHIGAFAEFLMDGSEYGVSITYRVQKNAGGIADALSLAEDFVQEGTFPVILGDNYFEDVSTIKIKKGVPTIFTKPVEDFFRFGVFDPKNRVIVEKPTEKISDLAIPGLYIYDKKVFDYIKEVAPSARGELEISDVNNLYLNSQTIDVVPIDTYWIDMGTPQSLAKAISYVMGKPGYDNFQV